MSITPVLLIAVVGLFSVASGAVLAYGAWKRRSWKHSGIIVGAIGVALLLAAWTELALF